MTALVNVGLDRPDGGINTVRETLDVLAERVPVGRWIVRESATEPTVVAEVLGIDRLAAEYISERLAQDCIAVLTADGGYLAGPKAAEWGPFDPAYFLTFEEAA